MNRKIKFIGLAGHLQKSVLEISKMLGLDVCETAKTNVHIIAGNSLSIRENGGEIVVSYQKQNEIYRALSFLSSFLSNQKEVEETAIYETLCYMGDMSRNAVYNMDSAKRMIRYLAVMGYNSLMLYTEDTYALPGYQYFGHMRGRFSESQLKEIDDYAFDFGIEVIPCVQTLAHLSTAIRWPDLFSFRDTEDILCVGDEKTYEFVEAILIQCAKCFRTKRIHLGMDEAHNLGLGKYLGINGYKKASDIMIEHLNRVMPLCEKYGFKPMIWSDMFFRMAFDGQYYVSEGEIPPEVVARVPEGLDLVYWDYYTTDFKTVDHMVKCHQEFDNAMIFAGGAWKWSGFGAHNAHSLYSSKIQLDVLDAYGVKDVIVTGWGDDGGEASQFSVLASMLFFAERSYHRDVESKLLDKRAEECFGISLENLLAFDLPDSIPGCELEKIGHPVNPSKYLLYNDIFEGFFDAHMDRNTVSVAYAKNAEKLFSLKDDHNFGYAFESLGKLCSVLELKSDMGIRIREAYSSKDNAALGKIANTELPELVKRTNSFLISLRKQWHTENKPFGFSVQEIRLGGLITRFASAAIRLNAYLAGEIPAIEELEAPNLPISPLPGDAATPYVSCNSWHEAVCAGQL